MSSRRQTRDVRELERFAAANAAALDDARALALEMSRGVPSRRFDAISAGLVLLPDELVYRWVGAWLVVPDAGSWAAPSWAETLVTDQRLLCRCDDGRLVSLPWAEVAGLQIMLDQQRLVLNFGGDAPIALMGVGTVAIAVAAVARVYGLPALLTHPCLAGLRRG